MGTDDLDALLVYLYNNRRYQKIAEVHKNTFPNKPILEVLIALNKLVKDEYITDEEQQSTTRNAGTREITDQYTQSAYFIAFEGILFIEDCPAFLQNRPYKWKQHKATTSTIWVVAKTIAIIANALIVIYLAYLAYTKD